MHLNIRKKSGLLGRAAELAFVAAVKAAKVDSERDRLNGEYRPGTDFHQQVSDLDVEATSGEASAPQNGPSELDINRYGGKGMFR